MNTTIYTFPITVNYGKSLAEMIADGRYDWKNADIKAENFPVTGKGVVNLDVTLVHLSCDTRTKDVARELATLGLEPAKIEHLLAFGAAFPKVQREYPIICLGASWVVCGDRYVPYLDQSCQKRDLNLYWTGSIWENYFRFLAIPK